MKYPKPNILLVDNYDSFTYNLVQILREISLCDFEVIRNDEINADSVSHFDGFVFSPGPGIPSDVPVMSQLLDKYSRNRGFLGVCLGHQAIAGYFGMKVARLGNVRHGLKATIRVTEPRDYLFDGMPSQFTAGLYHSWGVYQQDNVDSLRITAFSEEGIIMALAHKKYNIRGVQFHPESYISEYGSILLGNFVRSLQ